MMGGNKMYERVFISHSKNDPNLDFFHKVFSGIRTESKWMELEDITYPPWESIRWEINQSDALFVLLSAPLKELSHIRNWVSFEIGLAANYRKPALLPVPQSIGLDIYVFEPIDIEVEFPVPCCTYYMLYGKTVEEIKFLQEMIRDAPFHNKGAPIKCPNDDCQIEFKLLTDINEFRCPACRKGLVIQKPQPSAV